MVPKVGIAYAGTYATGMAAWRWYETGELIPREELARIAGEARTIGMAKARELIEQARSTGEATGNTAKEMAGRVADRVGHLVEQARQRGHQTLRRVRHRLPLRRPSVSSNDSE